MQSSVLAMTPSAPRSTLQADSTSSAGHFQTLNPMWSRPTFTNRALCGPGSLASRGRGSGVDAIAMALRPRLSDAEESGAWNGPRELGGRLVLFVGWWVDTGGVRPQNGCQGIE